MPPFSVAKFVDHNTSTLTSVIVAIGPERIQEMRVAPTAGDKASKTSCSPRLSRALSASAEWLLTQSGWRTEVRVPGPATLAGTGQDAPNKLRAGRFADLGQVPECLLLHLEGGCT